MRRPPEGLLRLYRGPAGQVRLDTLFSVQRLGLPPRVERNPKEPQGFHLEQPYIVGFALSADASTIVVGVCTRGYCGGLGWPTPDAQTTLFRSQDGGVTWKELGRLGGGHFVAAIANEGVVLANFGTEQAPVTSYQLYPSGIPLEPPPQASPSWWPLSLPNGELVWRTDDARLIRSDGSQFLALALGANARLLDFTPDPTNQRFLIGWFVEQAGRPASVRFYLGVAAQDGRLSRALSPNSNYLRIGGWLDSRIAMGDVWAGWLTPATPPALLGDVLVLVDVEAGQVNPVAGLPLPRGRNNVQAVLPGPFARVIGTGSCLNVRAEPGGAARVVACAADGVLLRDLGERRDVGGEAWLRVAAPGGSEGWASAAYLER